MTSVEDIIHYTFRDKSLLTQACTHPSKLRNQKYSHFERLEFLGDRVLGLVVSNLLYHYFPEHTEGELASRYAFLVSREMCNTVCINIGLYQFIEFRHSDMQSANLSIAANGFEAIVGAMFLDGGLAPCQKFLEQLWTPYIESAPQTNPKGVLQELAARQGWEPPIYTVNERTGPEHSPVFTVTVNAHNQSAVGTGPTRKNAEQNAARLLCENLNF
jgi:ribonuclease-3